MSEDLHAPATAGPTPEPTPTVPAGEATKARPAGSAAAGSSESSPVASVQQHAAAVQSQVQAQVAEKPELLVGAAFAGGVIAAFLLKRIGG